VKLVGQLASALAAPLQECTTLESIHAVSLNMFSKIGRQPLALPALVSVVSARCATLVRKSWPSMESLSNAIPLLEELWRIGLLFSHGDTVRTSFASAFAHLVSGGRKEGLPPCSAGGGSGFGRESMDQRLQRWVRSCDVFADAAAADLFSAEGAALVEQELYAELRRILTAVPLADLKRAAANVKCGSVTLCRGAGLAAERVARSLQNAEQRRLPNDEQDASRLGESFEISQAAADRADSIVAAIAYEALRSAELAAERAVAQATREALSDAGLFESSSHASPLRPRNLAFLQEPSSPSGQNPKSGFLRSTGLPSRIASQTSSLTSIGAADVTMWNGNASSEHVIASAKRQTGLSAMAGGLLRLQAARNDMRGQLASTQHVRMGHLQAMGTTPPQITKRKF